MDKPTEEAPPADELVDEPTEEAPPVDEPTEETPPADKPVDEPVEDKDATATEATEEKLIIPVTWQGNKEYTGTQNSKVIYTAVLPENYALADGVKALQIYVIVGGRARAAVASYPEALPRTTSLKLNADADLSYVKTDGSVGVANPAKVSINDSAEGWAWDLDSKTLTLTNANITSMGTAIDLPDSASTSIVLQGNNVVQGGDESSGITQYNGSMTFKGDGALYVSGGTWAGGWGMAGGIVGCYADVIIESGTITANSGTIIQSMYAGGIMASNQNKVIIKGGVVTSICDTANKASMSGGIYGGGGTTIDGGLLIARSDKTAIDSTPTGTLATPLTGTAAGNFAVFGDPALYTMMTEGSGAIGLDFSNNTTTSDWSDSANSQGWKWDYDAAGSTLSLKNLIINVETTGLAADSYGIQLPTNTTIVQYGNNVIHSGATSGGSSTGIFGAGNITVSGDDDLYALGDKGTGSAGIEASGVVLSSGAVTSFGGKGSSDSYGIKAATTEISGGTGTAGTTGEATAYAFSIQPTGTLGSGLSSHTKQSLSWPANKYVTFDVRNGAAFPSAKIGADKTITLPTIEPKWEGYTFGGWYKGKDGAGGEVTAADTYEVPTTVYAKWTKNGKLVRTIPLDLSTATANVGDLDTDGWAWDFASNTLTLSGATIYTTEGNAITLPSFATSGSEEVKIILADGSSNTIGSNTIGIGTKEGSGTKTPITILGKGSLDVSGNTSGIQNHGAPLNMTGGIVTASGAYGVYGKDSVVISGGTLNVNGHSYGVNAEKDITVTGGKLKASSGYAALYCNGVINYTGTVTGAKETFTSGTTKKLTQNNANVAVVLSFTKAVSFDSRGGSFVDDVDIDESMTLLKPTWTGYVFDGWYSGIDGIDAESSPAFTGKLDLAKAKALTASTTVYAKWTKGGKTVRTTPLDLTSMATTDKTATEGWKWDDTSKTLTLNGVYIDCSGNAVATEANYGIKLPSADSIITLVGNNIVKSGPSGNINRGIWAEKNLTISGGGILNVTAGTGSDSNAIFTAPLTIIDSTVTATDGTGVRYGSGIEVYGPITVNSGTINATASTGSNSRGMCASQDITILGGTVNAKGVTSAISSSNGTITADGATVTGTTETFASGTTQTLTQTNPATPVIVGFGPSITTATQTGTATYGTPSSPTYAVTASSFSGTYPAFAPTIAWTSGKAPTGVTTAFTGTNKETLTINTTATTPAGEHKFKVVSPKKAPETGNYESTEATLKVDKLGATITWGTTTSFPYNASAQAPTATVANKVGTDAVTVTVTGSETNVGTNHTATADALAGAAAGNYELSTTKPTQTFAITAKSVTVTDGDLEIKKAYDANKTAGTVTAGKLGLTGVVATDTANVSVKVDTIGDYADANVGKNKTVTLTISLDGTAKDNYTLGSTTTYTFQKAEITKVAYTGTKADAPSSTPTAKTDKSITLASVTPPTGEAVQYAKSTTNTAPTSDADWQDSTTFTGLTPNTEYFFFARVKENDNHAPGGESTGTSITTDKANYTGTQATAPSKTPASKSADSITLAPVTPPTGKDIQYAISTTATAPTSDSDWQDSVSFTGLDADKEYYFFARVKENATHKAGKASTGTKIKTDLSNEQKVAAAKTVVDKALKDMTVTNATDANSVIAALNKALTDAGITGVTPSFDPTAPFAITKADEDNTGTITGTIKLECGSGSDAKSDTTTLNKTIPQLPSDPKEKVKLVKAAMEAALKAYTATNATTDADIKKIADDANTASGVTGVTIAWGTPAFQNTNSTDTANGKATGTLNLSCTKAGVTATDKISVNCPIERSDAQKLAGAILDANKAKNSVSIDARPASSVPSGTKFVTAAAQQKLTDAIAVAQAVADNTSATDAEIKAATTALQTAIKNFKASIQTGTYTEPSNDNNTSSNDSGSTSSTPSTPSTPSTGSTSPVAPTTPPAKPGIEVPGLVGQDGKVNVIITDQTMKDAIAKAIAEAKKNGTTDKGLVVTIYVTTGKQNGNITGGTTGNTIPNIVPNTVTVSLPKTVQETVITSNISNTVVVVDRPDIAINMNLATIHEIYRQAQSDVQLSATRMDNNLLSMEAKSAIGNRPTFDLSATYADGSKSVTNFGLGLVTVEIPYTLQEGENASDICAVYVDEKGKVSVFANSVYDTEKKMLRFVTNHFSIYGVANKAGKQFPEATFLTALTSYTVQKGDSFWKIARMQKCNMFELAKVNGKNIFNTIYIGEVLTIPQK